jgi:hypothetical protein
VDPLLYRLPGETGKRPTGRSRGIVFVREI